MFGGIPAALIWRQMPFESHCRLRRPPSDQEGNTKLEPTQAEGKTALGMVSAINLERRDGSLRQGDYATATLRLGFLQRQLAAHEFE